MKTTIIVALTLALLPSAVTSVWGAVLGVPDPYPSIQEAAAAASPGDTILVSPGVYEDSVWLHVPVLLLSTDGADDTVIQYAGGMFNEGVWVDGFPGELYRIEGFMIRGFERGVSAAGAHAPTVEVVDCIMTECGYGFVGGGYIHGTVRGCSFIGNSSGPWGGAIELLYADCVLVEYNLIVGNNAGVDFCGTSYAGCPVVEVSHNTIVGNRYGVRTVSDDAISLHSNIIAENSFAGVWCAEGPISQGTGFVIECNDVWANGTNYLQYCDDQTGLNGNISDDPMFCNPLAGDYTLVSGSPCVGTGMAGTDMGAFGVGCEQTLVIAREFSWGTIKALYR